MTRWRLFLFLLAGLSLLSGCAPDPKMVQKATFHLNLGTSYLQQGDPTSALRELYEAEKQNPKTRRFSITWNGLSAKGNTTTP